MTMMICSCGEKYVNQKYIADALGIVITSITNRKKVDDNFPKPAYLYGSVTLYRKKDADAYIKHCRSLPTYHSTKVLSRPRVKERMEKANG